MRLAVLKGISLVSSESLSSETSFSSGFRDLFVSGCLLRSCISGFLLRLMSTSVLGFFLSLLGSGFRDLLSRGCLLKLLSFSLFLLRLGVSGFRDLLPSGFLLRFDSHAEVSYVR